MPWRTVSVGTRSRIAQALQNTTPADDRNRCPLLRPLVGVVSPGSGHSNSIKLSSAASLPCINRACYVREPHHRDSVAARTLVGRQSLCGGTKKTRIASAAAAFIVRNVFAGEE